jgi:D-glycero-alpha-D-manno-heptose-7-phosphate kinase
MSLNFGEHFAYPQAHERGCKAIPQRYADEMYDEARRHGALGGKITGAGGGGYLLLYCEYEKKHKVAEAVKKLGGIPTEFSFEFHGLQTWRRNGHGNNGDR